MLKRASLGIVLGLVLSVLCAAVEPVVSPVRAQLACPTDVERLIERVAARNLDKVLTYYDSWAGKELKAGRKPATGLTIAVAEGGLSHDVPIMCFWGAIRRLQQMGAKVEYMVPGSINDYAACIENLMAKKPDAIIVGHGNNQILGSALQKAAQRKIPLFGVDNWLDGPTVISEVTSNNFEIGIRAAQFLVQELKGKGNVVHLYTPGLRSIEIRHRMYEEVLQEFVNIKEIAEIPYENPFVETARSRMEAVLIANPKKGSINAVHACFDTPGFGAADAIEAAGRENEIFVVGIDGDREALRRIARGGAFKATVSQDFLQMATVAALSAVDYLRGKSVPRFIYVPVTLVTKENVYQHYKDKFGEDLKL